MTQSDATIHCWKYGIGENSFPPLSAEKFRQKKFNWRIPGVRLLTQSPCEDASGLKNCCYKTFSTKKNKKTFWFRVVFTKKCLPLWILNKALLLRPGLSMTMAWYPWDFYGNWLNLCNLIKVLGSKQLENENSGWSCGWNGRKWRTVLASLTDIILTRCYSKECCSRWVVWLPRNKIGSHSL